MREACFLLQGSAKMLHPQSNSSESETLEHQETQSVFIQASEQIPGPTKMGFYPVLSGIDPRWVQEVGCCTRVLSHQSLLYSGQATKEIHRLNLSAPS